MEMSWIIFIIIFFCAYLIIGVPFMFWIIFHFIKSIIRDGIAEGLAKYNGIESVAKQIAKNEKAKSNEKLKQESDKFFED